MIYADMGFDSKAGTHQTDLTPVELACIDILLKCGVGKDSAISAWDLAGELSIGTRHLRALINHLIITHNQPIMSEAGHGGGYYLPGDPTETARFKSAFHKRAMTGLIKAARGSKAAYVETMYQYTLGFDDPQIHSALEQMKFLPAENTPPAWVQLVTKFLDRFTADPVVYAAEIKRIQEAYGDIFVPQEKVQALREKSAALKAQTMEFQKFLNDIG